MNKNNYLSVGIHTEQINTKEEIKETVIGIDIQNHGKDSINGINKYKLNVNTNQGYMIRDLKTFMNVKLKMINNVSLKKYETARVDVAIDSSIIDFQTNYNINKLLNQLVGLQYDVDDNNDYRTVNNRNNKPKSSNIKSRAFDIENYDKALESPEGKVLNRLEFRIKQITRIKENEKEVYALKKVINILNKSITKENFDRLTEMNTETLLRYIANEGKKDTAVLSQNIELIISKKQLIDIFTALGYNAPDRKANKWIEANKPKLFKFKDLESYSNQIQKCIKKMLKTA